jgi:hypothetical protein
VNYASDAMTPQKINGALAAWDGRAGEISVIQSKVFFHISAMQESRSGSTLMGFGSKSRPVL